MRGAGRPAADAAAPSRGATCDSIACSLPIQRIVPSVSSPATRSSRGARAATSTGTGGALAQRGSPAAWTRKSSPSKWTVSPRSSPVSTRTYSSVWRPAWS